MKNYSFRNDMEFLQIVDEYISCEYVKQCLRNCLEGYVMAYHKYKKWYDIVSVIGIIFPTIIIVMNDIQDYGHIKEYCKVTISVLSAVVAIASGLGSLYKWHERSIRHRSCVERIKRETIYYIAGLGRYCEPEQKEQLFLQKIASIRLQENANWTMSELKQDLNEGSADKSDVKTDVEELQDTSEDSKDEGGESYDNRKETDE